MIVSRPNFEDIRTYAEFERYYWYLHELSAICKSHGLEYVGGKIQLNKIIKSYFDGIIIPHKKKQSSKCLTSELTLDTKVIDCGFTFGQKFREFFITQTGDKNFKFTADMVATVKTVKANNDDSFTLGDLLDVKLGKKTYTRYDNSSCQWNRFLKDFCADEINDIYPNKLKAASKFWAILRASDMPKVYSREFIESHKDELMN